MLCSILVSCSGGEELWEPTQEKKEFFIQTKLWTEFANNSLIKKVWQVSSSQDISLSANTNWRVTNVRVKVWDTVTAGQVIANLEDNIWNLWINLQRSNISIERAKINYESNKISLDKQIFDAQQQLENLQRSLATAQSDAKQNLLLAQDTVDNSSTNGLDSQSALRLQQLDNNIEKAELDYQIKLSADEQQIASYSPSLRREFNALSTFLDDVIDFSDNILWVTDVNRNQNRRFDQFLWALDTQQKTNSKNFLRALIATRDSNEFLEIDTLLRRGDLGDSEILDAIEYISDRYETIDDLLMSLEQTLFNSTPSVWELSEQEIDWYLSQINWFQSQSQASYGWFISFWSSVKTFLKTYKDNQSSILKSIELQKKDREIQSKTLGSSELSAEAWLERTKISTEDTIKSLESQVRSAQNSLENAIQNKSVTLRSLENAIKEANVGYASSAKEYSKLVIRSPINGTISDVFVDVGQEVFSWNQLFNIVSDSTPEVQLAFSDSEKDLVQLGQKVKVRVNTKEVTWTIYSISDIADQSLNYKSTVVFDSWTNIIWNIVDVEIPVSTGKVLLPINIIETQGDNIWLVNVYSWSTIQPVRIRMWEIFGEYVELVSCAQQCEELNIIISDTSNYDENKFILTEK